MKKIFSIAAISALLATAVNADMTRIEGAVGAWQSTPSGTVQYAGNPSFDVADNAGFEATTNAYAWLYIKHPIPVLPNLRLEYADPNFSGTTTDSIVWNGNSYGAGASNDLSFKQYDAVLYYNILDNLFWTTLDLGVDIKYIDGNYQLTATGMPNVDEAFSLVMPLGYLRGRIQLPLHIGVEAIVRGMAYSSNNVVDAEVKIDYTMEFVPVVQPGIEIGYRYQQLKLDGDSIGIDANLDTKLEGLYAGVMVRF